MKAHSIVNTRFTFILLGMISIGIFASCDNKHEKSDAYGNFELDKTVISAEAAGQILWLEVEEGMQLKANEVIGQVDTIDLHLQKEQLKVQQQLILTNIPDVKAQVDVLKQQRENVLISHKRVSNLLAKKAATQKQFDDIQANLDVLEKQISATEVKILNIQEQSNSLNSQIEILKHKITKCTIDVPITGTVLSQFSRVGEMTAPGKPMFTMAALKDIRLKVYVSGDMLPQIKLHQKVSVLIDKNKDENKMLDGEIVWISSEAEFTPKTVQTKEERVNLVYAVKIKVDNNGELKAGMPGEMVLD